MLGVAVTGTGSSIIGNSGQISSSAGDAVGSGVDVSSEAGIKILDGCFIKGSRQNRGDVKQYHLQRLRLQLAFR